MKKILNTFFASTPYLGLIVLFDFLILFQRYTSTVTFSYIPIFLLLYPGYMLLQLTSLRNILFWEKVLFCIGLSLFFDMFYGLEINQLGLWLHIPSPLSLSLLLPAFTSIFVMLAFIVTFLYGQNYDFI